MSKDVIQLKMLEILEEKTHKISLDSLFMGRLVKF